MSKHQYPENLKRKRNILLKYVNNLLRLSVRLPISNRPKAPHRIALRLLDMVVHLPIALRSRDMRKDPGLHGTQTYLIYTVIHVRPR